MVRRFIDDIIVISENNTVPIEIIENFKNTFKEHDLNLTSTIMSSEKGINALPFLDVEHIFTKANEKSFFYTRNFTKATAINSTFLNGKSFHPLNTFKGIITGEEKRMKRTNERKEDYFESLKKLKTKCIKSNFNLKLIEDQFEKICRQNENENMQNKEKEKTNNKNIYWSSQFKKILKFTKKESKLFPLGKISFTKPENLRKLLNNYSQIAKQKQTKTVSSKKCKKCALCGNHGQHKKMVLKKEMFTIQGKIVQLQPNLNCKS